MGRSNDFARSRKDTDLLTQVEEAIRRHRMLRRGETVVVAVSGGPDSMALLDLLDRLRGEWRLRLHVAHLNHQLRGAAADADEAFVRAECQRRRLPCVVGHARVADVARERELSEETAARQARYEFLQQAAAECGAGAIAVGHTRDDQAETVLMRLLRGSGAEGLCGIRPVRPLGRYRLVRPLLSLWRRDIEAYLRGRRRRWREDASNRDTRYLRNRIRHALLPLLEREYQPRLRQVLSRTAEALRADYAFIEAWGERRWRKVARVEPTRTAPARVVFDVTRLSQEPPAMQRYLLRRAVECVAGDLRRISYQHWMELEELVQARPGESVVALPRGLQAVKRSGAICIERGGCR